ncbi:MAG: nuclear transport factor 2 family protein [Anaerolineae bacterium]|nr:nuclear transport factor 2 family protein [Anaerolineae bacterium]
MTVSDACSEVRRVFQQYQDYYTARDPKNLDACMALFTRDGDVEVVGTGAITPGTDEWCDGHAKVRELTRSDWEGWGDVRFDVDGALIHAVGDVAWLTTTGTVATTYEVAENLRGAVKHAKEVLDEPGDDEGRLKNMLMWATLALAEAHRGEHYVWPIRFSAVLAREGGEWRFRQAHFSFPTTRFPDERWTDLRRPAPRRVDASAD